MNQKLTPTRPEYLKYFADEISAGRRQTEALKQATDIRKCEIELYGKRAAYFWTFIGATFAAYFVIQKDDHSPFNSEYLIECVGFVFSLAWYFVNRGSKTWQRNWETQVDLLEDEVIGPLYKSEINRYDYSFWDLANGFPFSPSRINHILGLFVTTIWLFLACRSVWLSRPLSAHVFSFVGLSLLTSFCLVLLIWKGRSSPNWSPTLINHTMREMNNRDPLAPKADT